MKKRDVFTRYGAQARAVLDALLDKYAGDEPGRQAVSGSRQFIENRRHGAEFALRFRCEKHPRYPDHPDSALPRDPSSLCVVDEEKSSAPLLGECNRLRFAPIQMPGNFRNDVPVRCRLHGHPSGFQCGGERLGARTPGTEGSSACTADGTIICP